MLFKLKESFPAYYRYYGRRIAKRLSPSLSKVFENSYKKFSIDQNILDIISNKIGSKKYILNKNFKKHIIEIGFGDGDHLVAQSMINKDVHYIGCEVFVNGLGKVLKKIISHFLTQFTGMEQRSRSLGIKRIFQIALVMAELKLSPKIPTLQLV